MRKLLAFGTGSALVGIILLAVAFFYAYDIVSSLQATVSSTSSSGTFPLLEDATIYAIFLGIMAGIGYALIAKGLDGIRKQEMMEMHASETAKFEQLEEEREERFHGKDMPPPKNNNSQQRKQPQNPPPQSQQEQQQTVQAAPVMTTTTTMPTQVQQSQSPQAPATEDVQEGPAPIIWEGEEPPKIDGDNVQMLPDSPRSTDDASAAADSEDFVPSPQNAPKRRGKSKSSSSSSSSQ